MNTKKILMTAALVFACGMVLAQEKFDVMAVRDDIFAGMSGNKERFEHGMKVIEETLEKNPNHAEAKVMFGAALFFKSNDAARSGDFQSSAKLMQQGLGEMEQAVQLAPENVSVLIPRGAVLITSSRFMPPQMGKPLLETGVSDFEKTLKLQGPEFSRHSVHARGELLTGLADGWSRMGNQEKARQYFDRITRELGGTVYAQNANAWLENKPEAKSPTFFNCSGCHVQ